MGEYKAKVTAFKSGKEGAYAFLAVMIAILLEVQVRQYVPGFEGGEQNATTVVLLTTALIAGTKALRNFIREVFFPKGPEEPDA